MSTGNQHMSCTGYDVPFHVLQQLAVRAGIEVVGVTTADVFHDVVPQLQRYYAEGRQTGFEHPYSQQRVDPVANLPSAKSIVAIAVPYRIEETMRLRRPKGLRGSVSMYAFGHDYHRVLKKKLQSLVLLLTEYVGREIDYQMGVDTSPLVDRAVAVRAGLGWIGKNGMLITKAYGSWVFLGSLLTDLLIEPQSTVEQLDSCGTCTLCITACPTGALVDPYILDGQRCISYLTQSKGIIPEEYREPIGKRLWGCDVCQNVCPKNNVTLLGSDSSFAPVADLGFPELLHILSLSRRAFMREFGHTATAWRGYYVWRRNAIMALGNLRAKEAIWQLVPFLTDPREEIRAMTAWALSRIAPEIVREIVAKAYSMESDPYVKSEMQWACDDHTSL